MNASYKKRYIKPKISPTRNQNEESLIDIIITQSHVLRIINDNPFIWDGSYLGTIDKRNIENQMEFMNLEYWKINIYGHSQICIARQITSSCPCISDELKILFGLSKLGTHRISYLKKSYVLIKSRISESGEIVRETSIGCISSTDNTTFIKQVRDIYLFRDILGLTKTNDSSIIIRWPNQHYIPPYPVSFYDNKIRPHDTKTIVPNTVIKKWFGFSTLNESARQIFRVKKIDEVPARLVYIQEQLNTIIERVDRNAVWMISLIMERLTRRILFGFENTIKITPQWN